MRLFAHKNIIQRLGVERQGANNVWAVLPPVFEAVQVWEKRAHDFVLTIESDVSDDEWEEGEEGENIT